MWCANPRLYRQVPRVFPLARRDLRIPQRLVRSSGPLCFGCQRRVRRGHWASLSFLASRFRYGGIPAAALIRRPASACRQGWSHSLRQALGASSGPRKEKRDQAWARMPRPISSYYVTRLAMAEVKGEGRFLRRRFQNGNCAGWALLPRNAAPRLVNFRGPLTAG
jgi:hypothetical protein